MSEKKEDVTVFKIILPMCPKSFLHIENAEFRKCRDCKFMRHMEYYIENDNHIEKIICAYKKSKDDGED